MAHLALFSFSVGMTPEQQLALVRGEREPEAASVAEAETVAEAAAEAEVEPAEEPAPAPVKRSRKG